MPVTRRVALAAMILLAAALGCGRGPTQPPVAIVLMALRATPNAGSPASRVAIVVGVSNAGPTQVSFYEGCGCDAFGFTVLGPDGKAVLLSDPRYPYYPDCPCGPVPFPPREDRSGGFTFTGTLYVPDSPAYPSPTYAAPAGRYTVIARFWYLTGSPPAPPEVEIQRRTTFDWQP